MKFGFLKSRWFWVGVGVLVIGGGLYAHGRNANKGPFYETQTVQQGTVRQTVDVTGQITPDNRLDLAFKNGGMIQTINVKAGDLVKKDQILATLDMRDLQFSADRARAVLANAQANLAARAAGETRESIQIAQASLDQAKANLTKAQNDLAIARVSVEDDYHVSQLALSTAQQNYDNAIASNDQIVKNGYESLRTTLQTALGSAQSSIVDVDNILGVDNTSVNGRYDYVLGVTDHGTVTQAKSDYLIARNLYRTTYVQLQALGVAPTETAVQSAALATRETMNKVQVLLDDMQRVLAATIPGGTMTTSELAAKKAQMDSDRATVSAQLASVNTSIQTVTNAQLTRTTNLDQLQNAVETARTNLNIADHNRTTKVKTAETNVALQTAAVVAAQAALDQKKAGPRAVDLAPLRAQVTDAQTAYTQALERLHDMEIIAPVDGVVANVDPKVGEQIAPNAKAISMIGNQGYTIEALIPEGDIAKVHVGQSVTLTLESFGDDIQFTGSVISENPDQTKVQDAIYYKVHIGVDPQEGKEIKPGMTANITILTGERKDVLFINNRAVRDVDGTKMVRVLKNNQAQDVTVNLGLRGDEGRVEVASGLQAGDQVILAELTAEEHAALQTQKK
jgi:RND family efflux transporter MFP subunit